MTITIDSAKIINKTKNGGSKILDAAKKAAGYFNPLKGINELKAYRRLQLVVKKPEYAVGRILVMRNWDGSGLEASVIHSIYTEDTDQGKMTVFALANGQKVNLAMLLREDFDIL